MVYQKTFVVEDFSQASPITNYDWFTPTSLDLDDFRWISKLHPSTIEMEFFSQAELWPLTQEHIDISKRYL